VGAGAVRRRFALVDRDGTINEERHHLAAPEDVALIPGSAAALVKLRDLGLGVVVVTNQAEVGRGNLERTELDRIHARLTALLADEGATVDAIEVCPHRPEDGCDCRKPGLGMYRQAIAAYGLDARRSLFVGDRWRDVAPSASLGGFAVLLDTPSTPDEEFERASHGGVGIASSLSEAVDRYLDALPALGDRQ